MSMKTRNSDPNKRRNRVIMIGDSITSNTGGVGTWFEASIINSRGLFSICKNVAKGGEGIQYFLDNWNTLVMSENFDEMWIQIGTNNITGVFETDIANFRGLIDELLALATSTSKAFIRVFSIPPRADLPKFNDAFNFITYSTCQKYGVQFIDIWSDSVNPTNGAPNGSGLDYYIDSIHPSNIPAGLACSVISSALDFPSKNMVMLPNSAIVELNDFTNPLCKDTDLNGIADSFEVWNETTKSVIAADIGKKQVLTTASNATSIVTIKSVQCTVDALHRFSCRLKATQSNSKLSAQIQYKNSAGVTVGAALIFLYTLAPMDGILDIVHTPTGAGVVKMDIIFSLLPISYGVVNMNSSLEISQVFSGIA